MLKVHVISLGCPKNTVDTEQLLASLGIEIESVSSVVDSDIVFINTCGFIGTAVEESVDIILETVSEVAVLTCTPRIIVAGCLVGRYGKEALARDIPEVDLWLSNSTKSTWALSILSLLGIHIHEQTQKRLVSTLSYSWLKISEGCSHSCSFCTIPSIRGKHVSFAPKDILCEAEELLKKGVKELNIVAQDVTSWGNEIGNKWSLGDLLQSIGALPGLQWLRLLYLYPAGVSERLLETLLGIPTFVPYFDIPIQHAHPEVVASMGRPFAHDPWRVVERVRRYFPQCALRTSIIVGFPGETEEHFEYLLSFIEEVGFSHLGVFTYQQEAGTPAAEFPNQVAEEIKEERRARVLAIQSEKSRQYLSSFVGSELDILIDSSSPEYEGLYHGRAWFQAPEFDGVTYISGNFASRSPVGSIERALVTESMEYDIVAVV